MSNNYFEENTVASIEECISSSLAKFHGLDSPDQLIGSNAWLLSDYLCRNHHDFF